MTSEERFDRLERIAKLFVRAGLRERRNRRELDEKINIIINSQIENEERFARNEERFAQLADVLARTDAQVKALATDDRVRPTVPGRIFADRSRSDAGLLADSPAARSASSGLRRARGGAE